MKKKRPSSNNIVDLRAYFGSDALDTDYSFDDRTHDFLKDSLANPNPVLPQKFEKIKGRTIEQIITDSINAR